MTNISIIGSGGMAAAIGGLATRAGHTVEVVSREPGHARALADRIGATTGAYAAVPSGDLVVLAVPYSAVLGVVGDFGDALSGTLLVDITNPVDSDLTGFVTPAGSFGAREIAQAAPADARIVKAFNTQFAHVLAEGSADGRPLDVFLAGDDADAKDQVSAFASSLGLRAFDVGLLPQARTLEHIALLTLGVVAHSLHHTDFAVGLTLTSAGA